MNYTLHQLQIFTKVSELQSVTKASEELHLTQPAVSIQLKNFQDQFDVPLFEAVGRRIFITEFGREIAEYAKSILLQTEKIKQSTQAHKGLLTGSVKISVASTAKYVIPYFLTNFLKDHPAVDLKLDVTNKSQVVQSLEQNSVDLSMVSVIPDAPAVLNEELMENKLYLVGAAEDDRLGSQVNLKSLEKVPLIFREKGSATRLAMEQFIKDNQINASKTLQLTSNEAVKQAVIAGIGFSIMPLIGLRNEIQNGEIRIIKVKGLPITTNWNLIWRKEKQLSPVASELVKYVREHKKEVIDTKFDWYNTY
ncbi:MAG: LysR family transcriptional regulator [bacterium]|nr:LysR family transcriptional regulator [bacterium]